MTYGTVRNFTVMLAIAASALTLGGCASRVTAHTGDGSIAAPPMPTTPVPTTNDCAALKADMSSNEAPSAVVFGYAGAPGGYLPADFHPVSMVECRTRQEEVPGQGRWAVVDTLRSTGSVDTFVSALRAAMAGPAPTRPAVCTDDLVMVPWIALVDAKGGAFHVRIPTDYCDKPDKAVFVALGAVALKVVATDRVVQIQSAAGETAGCEDQWADLAMMNSANPGPTAPPTTGAPGPFFNIAGTTKNLKVCYYRLKPGYLPEKPMGTFQSGATLSGATSAAVYDGLAASPWAKPCSTAPISFAVVFTDEVKGVVSGVVELDGCRRASPNYGGVRQPTQSVIDALLAARH